MVHVERSMTKREFVEVARATLDQMGKSDYKVVMIDSPVEAALETPEMFMVTNAIAYTGTDTIYFYWYYLKHYTYSYQLATIRHEIVHAMSPSHHLVEDRGLTISSSDDWTEYFKSFSLPKEELYKHKADYGNELNTLIKFADENTKSPKKVDKVRKDINRLRNDIVYSFDKFDLFLLGLISNTDRKRNEEESFFKEMEDLFS